MSSISFTIPGEPKGKGRPRFARRGTFVSTYTPPETANYETQVKWYARQAMLVADIGKMLEGPLIMTVKSYFSIPKSMRKADRAKAEAEQLYCVKKPDRDNIDKIVSDAMNKIAYMDDAQIVDGSSSKRYSLTPRVEVTVTELRGPVIVTE